MNKGFETCSYYFGSEGFNLSRMIYVIVICVLPRKKDTAFGRLATVETL
jgi:hypothetical protein